MPNDIQTTNINYSRAGEEKRISKRVMQEVALELGFKEYRGLQNH